jgi:hypothetical protein
LLFLKYFKAGLTTAGFFMYIFTSKSFTMEEEKISPRKILDDTLAEVRQNWENFTREFGREWKAQLRDEHSPLKKITAAIPKPADMPEPARERILSAINDAKAIADSGFKAIKKTLRNSR